MTETEQARNALVEVVTSIRNNARAIEQALQGDTSGYVWVWPKHWLAVKFDADSCRAVGTDRATVTRNKHDRRVFTNGAGERASLMLREQALVNALSHTVEILQRFEEKRTP